MPETVWGVVSETLVSLSLKILKSKHLLKYINVLSIAAWFGLGIGVAAAIGLLGNDEEKITSFLRDEETFFFIKGICVQEGKTFRMLFFARVLKLRKE
ncbi:hypothetical protein [Bacillus sp. FJAT-29814]|uniref:hypothetical protein n=1 Tax=Bacillus sp. FJAT-29814 TaxID=1729688 RepID=UPI00082BA9C4|nr:hypothetical protein [Bacillus sp. FJAT-29814]